MIHIKVITAVQYHSITILAKAKVALAEAALVEAAHSGDFIAAAIILKAAHYPSRC